MAEETPRMRYWIADTLARERELHGVTPKQMAKSLSITERTIAKIEGDETWGQTNVQDMDAYVAGYAYVLGIDDSRKVWRQALERWGEVKEALRYVPRDEATAAFADVIRKASLRRRRDNPELFEEREAS